MTTSQQSDDQPQSIAESGAPTQPVNEQPAAVQAQPDVPVQPEDLAATPAQAQPDAPVQPDAPATSLPAAAADTEQPREADAAQGPEQPAVVTEPQAEETAELAATTQPASDQPTSDQPGTEQQAPEHAEAEQPAAVQPTAPTAPVPAPRPTPSSATRPVPAPKPVPGGATPSPAALGPRGAAPAAPVVAAPPAFSTPLEEAAKFSRVTDDGHVFVIVDGEEYPVGQYPDASREEALAYFVRKHDDIVSQLLLLEQRLAANAPTTDMGKTLDHLAELVAGRAMVGDLRALEARIGVVRGEVSARQKAERQVQEAHRAQELAAREAIVAEAEHLAAQDPSTVQWKQGSNRMNELFEQWKTAQKNGPRLGRATEDGLWKRFRGARTTFDRHRRAFFSQLDSENSEAKSAKEKLIARAEELSGSTDWGATAGEYRRLMDEWKASKRASRKDDDALWARFRAAQDVFFNARQATNQALDEEFEGNLAAKDAILAEAKALLPIKDLGAAKKAFESIRDRWEAAGKVPRSAMQRMEGGMRSVEDALRAAEDEKWRRSNPETKARTNSMLSQLEDTIAGLEQDLETARAKGNERKIRDAQEALDARRAWLETLEKSAQDFE